MIYDTQGNLFDSLAVALVNPVNCKGVMGKGLALEFRRRFPEDYETYRRACQAGEVRPGRILVTETLAGWPQYLVHFPTKDDWLKPSRLEWIETGLVDLRRWIESTGIASIAMPALGCGLGGLDWGQVRPVIGRVLGEMPTTEIWVYGPQ